MSLRCNYSGDKEKARSLYRTGLKRLDDLKTVMSFQKLNQLYKEHILPDGSIIKCSSIYGQDNIDIFSPVIISPEVTPIIEDVKVPEISLAEAVKLPLVLQTSCTDLSLVETFYNAAETHVYVEAFDTGYRPTYPDSMSWPWVAGVPIGYIDFAGACTENPASPYMYTGGGFGECTGFYEGRTHVVTAWLVDAIWQWDLKYSYGRQQVLSGTIGGGVDPNKIKLGVFITAESYYGMPCYYPAWYDISDLPYWPDQFYWGHEWVCPENWSYPTPEEMVLYNGLITYNEPILDWWPTRSEISFNMINETEWTVNIDIPGDEYMPLVSIPYPVHALNAPSDHLKRTVTLFLQTETCRVPLVLYILGYKNLEFRTAYWDLSGEKWPRIYNTSWGASHRTIGTVYDYYRWNLHISPTSRYLAEANNEYWQHYFNSVHPLQINYQVPNQYRRTNPGVYVTRGLVPGEPFSSLERRVALNHIDYM